MEIDVFDFDGTIYDGDSTADFVCFCLLRHPALLLSLPRVAGAALMLVMGKRSLTDFKNVLFSQMARRLSLVEEARRFWDRRQTRDKIGQWFLRRERDLPIVIASASPDFELRFAADLLMAEGLICTRCDGQTGRILGENCKSDEKIARLKQAYGDVVVRQMYTDNPRADGPLLRLAKEGYIVRHGKVTAWEGEPV